MSFRCIDPFRTLALLALPLAIAACNKSAGTDNSAPIPVTTMEVAPRAVPVVLEAVGRTEGSKEVEIRARVSGIVEKQLYAEGTFVRAGTPLFQIDRAPFEIALAQAQAAAEQEASAHEQAQRETKRLADLLVNGAVSKRLAEEASTAFRTATASLAAAQAKVREAQLNLSYTSVNAPIAGVTGRALHSEGSLVTANTDSSLLTTLSQTHPVWVRFALSEQEHERLKKLSSDPVQAKSSAVQLVLADGQPYEAPGHLNFSASTIDRQMGTVQLRAEFPNPKLTILPGQFATVRVQAGEQEVIAVPQTSVIQGSQGRFVWIFGSDGKASQRTVETGVWAGPDWIILSGLNAGDKVIIDNLMKLKAGGAVQEQALKPATAGSSEDGAGDKSASRVN
jgi:membrane fusion protein (multidrug efflux system)